MPNEASMDLRIFLNRRQFLTVSPHNAKLINDGLLKLKALINKSRTNRNTGKHGERVQQCK